LAFLLYLLKTNKKRKKKKKKECQYLCHVKCLPNVPQDCGSKESLSRKKASPTAKPSKLFGVELAILAGSENQIPPIIKACIEAVEKRGMETEGIYRLSGASTLNSKLREQFENGLYFVSPALSHLKEKPQKKKKKKKKKN